MVEPSPVGKHTEAMAIACVETTLCLADACCVISHAGPILTFVCHLVALLASRQEHWVLPDSREERGSEGRIVPGVRWKPSMGSKKKERKNNHPNLRNLQIKSA